MLNSLHRVVELNTVHLLIALPFNQERDPTVSWERGWEIISSVYHAINDSNILLGKTIEVTEIDTGSCQSVRLDFLIQLLNFTLTHETEYTGIIGMFCPFRLELIVKQLHTRRMLERVLRMAYAIDWNRKPLESRSAMVQALIAFCHKLQWYRIGVITEANNTIFSYFAEEFHSVYTFRMNATLSVYYYHMNIDLLGLPRIVLLSISATSLIDLLCRITLSNLTWPNRVWILHSYQLEDFYWNESRCNVTMNIENLLLFQDNFHYIEGLPLQSNPYSAWIYNATLSMATKLHELIQTGSRNIAYTSVQEQIIIVQINQLKESPIAIFANSQLTFTNLTFKETAPSDEIRVVYEGGSTLYTAMAALAIIIVFIIITVLLTAYIHFREEPEVKSTSFSLSLLIFLGCYLTLVHLCINIYLHQRIPLQSHSLLGVCLSLHFLSGLGIPNALILATVAVKMIRIYYIFNRRSPKKITSKCSDCYLLMYVLLLISPMILIYVIWTSVDPYMGFYQSFTNIDTVVLQKGCTNTNLTIWQSTLTVYVVMLFLILMILAIKMKDIERPHFRDTKKINVLILCFFLDLILTLAIWRSIYTVVKIYIADVVLHIGHHALILLCQMLLFVPKVLPPCIRLINCQHVKVKSG